MGCVSDKERMPEAESQLPKDQIDKTVKQVMILLLIDLFESDSKLRPSRLCQEDK